MTSKPFRARRTDTCKGCGRRVCLGDLIVMRDGCAAHATCHFTPSGSARERWERMLAC